MLILMFQRFTNGARRALALAHEEARLLDHDWIGTEHILLGLIDEGEGAAAKTLEAIGVTLEPVRAKVLEMLGPTESAKVPVPQFTPRAKRVLELSLRESLALGHNEIGTEHLLLALVREEASVAAKVLVSLGADPSQVRQRVVGLVAGSPQPRGTDTTAASGAPATRGRPPTVGSARWRGVPIHRLMLAGDLCALCGRDLSEVARYVAAGRVKVCDQCIVAASEIVKVAERQGHGPELRLSAPVLVGEPPDDDAVHHVMSAFDQALAGMADAADHQRVLDDWWVERIGFVGTDRANVRFGVALASKASLLFEGAAVRRDGQWTMASETEVAVLRRLGRSSA